MGNTVSEDLRPTPYNWILEMPYKSDSNDSAHHHHHQHQHKKHNGPREQLHAVGDQHPKLDSFSYIEDISTHDLLSSSETSTSSSYDYSCESCKIAKQDTGQPGQPGQSGVFEPRTSAERLNHRNISAIFFSDDANDHTVEHVYNKVRQPSSSSESSVESVDSIGSVDSDASYAEDCEPYTENDAQSVSSSASHTFLDMSTSSLVPSGPEYTTEIPEFYLPECVNYPYRSPYEFSDAEFERMNHFEFLKTINFKEPPLLPPYLNSNLLNDSASHNYRTYPYQYQYSNHVYINEQFRYNINDLNLMDKYSRQKTKSRSSRHDVKKRSGDLTQTPTPVVLKQADYDVPNYVMLNHLITCNLKMDNVLTGSCIHRYSGKFITQIVYFPMDMN